MAMAARQKTTWRGYSRVLIRSIMRRLERRHYLGTAWTFMPKRYVVDFGMNGGVYLEGHLIMPRGAEMPDDLFIVFAEWDCSIKPK